MLLPSTVSDESSGRLPIDFGSPGGSLFSHCSILLSALGQKLTFPRSASMSAKCQKRTHRLSPQEGAARLSGDLW